MIITQEFEMPAIINHRSCQLHLANQAVTLERIIAVKYQEKNIHTMLRNR